MSGPPPSLDVPAWLSAYVQAWRDRLYLQAWTIHLDMALCVDGDEHVRGLCSQQPDINTATLTFRADATDTPAWRRTVIHELLHVAHARIDHLLDGPIAVALPRDAQMMAGMVYRQVVESYIEALAHTLYRATVAVDYPDEVAADEPGVPV